MKSATTMLASIAVLFSGTASGQTQNGADMTKEMQAFCKQYDTTWNTKGAAAAANTLSTDNAVFVAPTGAVLKGKEALTKAWSNIFKEPTVHTCTVDAARAEGDGVLAYGETTISGTPASRTRWVAFDVKQNGQWKVQFLQVTALKEKE